MSQSSELSSGSGFTFEERVAATYLSKLLKEGFAPGVVDHTVNRVSLQRRSLGEPLDDVIVDFISPTGEEVRLSLQVKQSLTVSDAKGKTAFREVIKDCWDTLHKNDFRIDHDRYGAAVGFIAKNKSRDLKRLCEIARSSGDLNDFQARFSGDGNASQGVKRVRDIVAALISEASEAECTDENLFLFLKHFVLVEFDFLHEGQLDLSEVLNSLRYCLHASSAAETSSLWDRLCILAQERSAYSVVFDRQKLIHLLSPIFRLSASPNFEDDLAIIKRQSEAWVKDIEDDIEGARLERPQLIADLSTNQSSHRFVQIHGIPGSGKSVLLRRVVEKELSRGPVLFLKSDRLEGSSWAAFATAQGLSAKSLRNLLFELSAIGSKTIYIDGIDRLEKQHRNVVKDVIATIVNDPALDDMRIIVSLRDTGIEPLRAWLGHLLRNISVGSVGVKSLSDEEAESLADQKPRLRSMLFGAGRVREIVRRPFFAKILIQNLESSVESAHIEPHSEIDLIEDWWELGGYSSDGQSAIDRQRAIIELAIARAKKLDKNIEIKNLSTSTTSLIDELVSDGVVQHLHKGHTLRFSHDIFFEWAFFKVLVDSDDWIVEIRKFGEPPAVARVVELLSQAEYIENGEWEKSLHILDESSLRSQWTRAWLAAPLTRPDFDGTVDRFYLALKKNDHYFLKKLLVWFQAERTIPNPNILASDFPREEKIRFADQFGWPSDMAAWMRLIDLLARKIQSVPTNLLPYILSVFEVWQNAFSGMPNRVSDFVLDQSHRWLIELSEKNKESDWPKVPEEWDELGESREEFRETLVRLIFMSAPVKPELTQNYLKFLIDTERLDRSQFEEILLFSPTLAKSHPGLLVDLTLKHLKNELPEELRDRRRREWQAQIEWRDRIEKKPEEERTRAEKLGLEAAYMPLGIESFDRYDWDDLSINDDLHTYFPASPLREPFNSLFVFSPLEALKLVSNLCTHAITAWRQLHKLSDDRSGKPVPVEVEFPWGKQQFWGNEREYLWYRGTWAPNAIACALMALERWALSEVEKNQSAEDVISKVVSGNECIAVLGVAATIGLETEELNEVTFSLATTQRLLNADYSRWAHDLTQASASLIGFNGINDQEHVKAVKESNDRPVRRQELKRLLASFFLDSRFRERTKDAVREFKNNLPFEYEEQKSDPELRKSLSRKALEFAELVELANYEKVKISKDADDVAIVHVSPSANEPENVARAEEAGLRLREHGLWAWAERYFENGKLGTEFSVDSAIEFARKLDSDDLFKEASNLDESIDMRRGAIAATAAVALSQRGELATDVLDWARETIDRALGTPERRDALWSPRSIVPWHPCIFAARGLAADIAFETAAHESRLNLLSLIIHPLEAVSMAALHCVVSIWKADTKLGWSAIHLALSLCIIPPREHSIGPGESIHPYEMVQSALQRAVKIYESSEDWTDLPKPPAAWIRKEPSKQKNETEAEEFWNQNRLDIESDQIWERSPERWDSHFAALILNHIPITKIMNGPGSSKLLDLFSELLRWTKEKLEPPGLDSSARRRNGAQLSEWTNAYGKALAWILGACSLEQATDRFLKPIFEFEDDDHCWDLLSPMMDFYIRIYIYDSENVDDKAIELIEICLDRLLLAREFNPNTYRSGELHGFDQPQLAKALMFVALDKPASGAVRYANGDWSEVERLIPIVNKFVCSAGWSPTIMSHFLTLCERAKDFYSADTFADQVLHVINGVGSPLDRWHRSSIPSRIAGLVQHFSDRESPLSLELRQKLLRILDALVDIGDRRSAALQLSESFRKVQFGE